MNSRPRFTHRTSPVADVVRRTILVAVTLVVSTALCSCVASFTLGAPPDTPSCLQRDAHQSTQFNGPLVLIAQSVPSASLVPCLRPLPAGWIFQHLEAQHGRAVISLDFGATSAQAFTETLAEDCDTRGATPARSDEVGARRFDRITSGLNGYRGERYYRFPGGCVTYQFKIVGRGSTAISSAVSRSAGFVTRVVLRQYVRNYSDGSMELDPPPTGR